MPQDPEQVFVNSGADPGLVVGSSSTPYIDNVRYPTEEVAPTTIVNIVQYNLNTIGANNQVLINRNNEAAGDEELTYDANTNILTAETLSVGRINVAVKANLGLASRVSITGGSSGYVLSTDGSGNLSWISQQVATTTWSSLTGKPTFANVATSGNYNDLANIPTGMASTTYVDNKIANVTYANLSGTPTLATVATTGAYNDLSNLPSLSGVALSGNYNDLSNRPSIPSISGLATEIYVDNKIANVTYANLSGTPIIPTHTSNIINDSNYLVSSDLSDYATTSSLSSYALTTDIPTDLADLTDTTLLIPTDIANLADATNLLTASGIALTDISVGTPNTASGGGDVSYDNTTGVFTYTPPVIPDVTGFALASDIPTDIANLADATNLLTSGIALTDISIGADNSASGGGSLSYANSTGVFTYTPPVIPAAQIQSDWTQATNTELDYIKNKPTLVTNLDSLSDVTITSASSGQVLKYNGTAWVNDTDSTGGGASTGNITFDGDNIGSSNDVVNIVGNNYAQLESNENFIWVEETYAAIAVNDYEWTFHDDAVLTIANGANISQTTDNGGQKTFNITPPDTSDFEVVTVDGDIRLQTANSDGGPTVTSTWTFDKGGNLSLPQGTILSETANSTTITPPNALSGQGLVVRLTGSQGIASDHPGGFADGDTITITIIPDYNLAQVTGTVDYTFTGATSQQLGRALTGTLTFTSEPSKQITWTIPVSSTMTTFTITLSNAVGFSIVGLQNSPLTLTTSGSTEDHHIHLIAGDPSITDIYLGDDDQYVKIERNGGNVLIGTNTNTKQWTFDTNGALTFPGGETFENGQITATANGQAVLADNALNNFIWVDSNGAYIETDDGTENTWTFGDDGNLSMPGNTVVSAPDNTALRIRTSGSAYGATTLEYVNDINGVIPYNAKVRVAEQGVSISTSGDSCQWLFDPNGKLTIPNDGAGNGAIYSEAANVQLYTNKTGDARVNIRSKGTTGDKTWAFKDNGEVEFPDNTVQTTAYRNRPLNNLNLDGGSASTVFEIDMAYVDGGGSFLRGILSQDIYDGTDGGSTTTQFNNILDGGQA